MKRLQRRADSGSNPGTTASLSCFLDPAKLERHICPHMLLRTPRERTLWECLWGVWGVAETQQRWLEWDMWDLEEGLAPCLQELMVSRVAGTDQGLRLETGTLCSSLHRSWGKHGPCGLWQKVALQAQRPHQGSVGPEHSRSLLCDPEATWAIHGPHYIPMILTKVEHGLAFH